MATLIEKYKGEKIEREEEGFLWRKDGWFTTVEECRASIDYEIEQDEEFYGHLNVRNDTPCLAPAWYEER